MNEILLRLVALFGALIACPIAFCWAVWRARAQGIHNTGFSLMVMFGTIGGWLLVYGFPIHVMLIGAVFLVFVAPVVNILSAISIAFLRPRSGYHTLAMWFGLAYPVLLAGAIFYWMSERA